MSTLTASEVKKLKTLANASKGTARSKDLNTTIGSIEDQYVAMPADPSSDASNIGTSTQTEAANAPKNSPKDLVESQKPRIDEEEEVSPVKRRYMHGKRRRKNN